MKYVVASIYDSDCKLFVYDNGEIISAYDNNDKSCDELSKFHEFNIDFYDWLKSKYKDYDLVVVCKDGKNKIIVDNPSL